MKNNGLGNIAVFTFMVFLFITACDNEAHPDNNSMEFYINSIDADGSFDGITVIPTTKLILTFDRDIPGLSADDIKINAVALWSNPALLVSNADFPVIKGDLHKTGAKTYELTIFPGNSGRIKVGLDPYRGFTGWRAVDVLVRAALLFRGTTELTITGYGSIGGHVEIPARLAGIPFTTIGTATGTGIGNTAFSGRQLTSVSIPPTVTTIGVIAFNSNLLTDVFIPDSVSIMGINAFANNQLTRINIPSAITAIESGTFLNNHLTSVIIPPSVSTIGNNAFANNQLISVSIPHSVGIVGISAFANNQLTSVIISEGVTTIGTNAFANNQLTTIAIPGSVESLSGFNDNLLPDLVIPGTVTVIGINAFANNQLTSVTISEGVMHIRDGAFANNNLTSIIIPDSVRTIEFRAFSDNKLTSITIGADVMLASGSFGNDFESAYNAASKAAGTYTRPDIVWDSD